MKIKFIKEYKSIKSLPDINLSDFTILTGVNGAGKTHLLEGIIQKKIELEVEERKVGRIVHFDYLDFIVKNIDIRQKNSQQLQQKIKQLCDTHVISSEIGDIVRKINQLDSKIGDLRGQDQRKFIIYRLIYNRMFHTNLECLDVLPTIDEVIDFVMEQVKNMEISTQKEEIKIIYDQVANALVDISEAIRKNPGCADIINKSYSNSTSKEMKLGLIEFGDFSYSESVLGEKLMHDIKNYREKQRQNDMRRYQSEREKNVAYLKEEEFREINGIPPWELLNQVLKEYSCNGYSIGEVTHLGALNINDYKPEIYFVNQSTNPTYAIGVEDLSSGEKTLLALALMVYRQRQGEKFPRVLLLDEIDGNLHPSMIQQLLNVLQEVFVDKYGMKIILVTHSPTTIALAPDDSIFTMCRETDSEERIQKQDRKTALNILTEGYATLEQGIKLFDSISIKEISIMTEGHNVQYLKKANTFFGDENKIEIIAGAESRSGKTQLKILYDFFSRINHDKKIIFVWDCDAKKYKDLGEENNTIAYVFENNSENNEIQEGIENLFPKDSIRKGNFYKNETKSKDGGRHILPDKDMIREYFINYGDKDDFINFKPLFDWIKANHL